MCDETRGNGYWQFLSCLFLFHTHTHTKTKTSGFPQLAPPAVCELVLVANGQARQPTPPSSLSAMQTQSASGHTAHLLILTPEIHLLLMCN